MKNNYDFKNGVFKISCEKLHESLDDMFDVDDNFESPNEFFDMCELSLTDPSNNFDIDTDEFIVTFDVSKFEKIKQRCEYMCGIMEYIELLTDHNISNDIMK